MKVYIARHGEIEPNRMHVLSGRRVDVPLNETGRAQAAALAQDIQAHKEEYNIKEIYCSSMIRARETASYIEKVLGLKAVADSRIVEQDFGVYDGQDWSDPEYRRLRHSPFEKMEGGESILDVVHRGYSFLDEVLQKEHDGNVLIVCHNTVGRLLSTYFVSYTMDEYRNISWNNCELHAFEVN